MTFDLGMMLAASGISLWAGYLAGCLVTEWSSRR